MKGYCQLTSLINPFLHNRKIIKLCVIIKPYMDPTMAAFERIDERQQRFVEDQKLFFDGIRFT